MILKDEKLVVEFGGITMVSSKDNKAKTQWVLDPEAITGWYQGSGININMTVRPNQWGDFSEKPHPTSRMISVSGTAIANDSDALYLMRDQLAAVFSVDKYSAMSVTNSAGTRYATVAVEGTIEWLQQLDNVATYKINLYAPDPRLYSIAHSVQIEDSTPTGGLKFQITYPINFNLPAKQSLQYITNEGSVESWPTFKITGDFPSGFTVTDNLGNNVTYDGLVTMQAPVTIDMGRGTAIQSGRDVSVQVSQRDWISIPPKQSIRPSFLPKQDGVGWCDIIYKDTWI